jgi:hypothetical protein
MKWSMRRLPSIGAQRLGIGRTIERARPKAGLLRSDHRLNLPETARLSPIGGLSITRLHHPTCYNGHLTMVTRFFDSEIMP